MVGDQLRMGSIASKIADGCRHVVAGWQGVPLPETGYQPGGGTTTIACKQSGNKKQRRRFATRTSYTTAGRNRKEPETARNAPTRRHEDREKPSERER